MTPLSKSPANSPKGKRPRGLRRLWSRPTARRLAYALAALVLLGAAAWLAAPAFVEDPLPGVLERTTARTWRDRNGIPLYCQRTWQYEWRFDVGLDEISPVALRFMLGVEDARFYSHHGVDYASVLRAIFQNLSSGRIVSGASTISMQVAAMDYHNGRRTFAGKFVQAAKARKMERLHAKDEILEAYFNNIPFGGNFYGIEAASRYYFGMRASELTATEASLLCGLPQRPNRYRPDRHPEAARERQRRVLDGLARAGLVSAEEADRIFNGERLRYRDFTLPADFEQLGQAKDLSFLIGDNPPFRPGDSNEVKLSIDARLTERIRQVLTRRVAALDDVRDAAAVLLDARTGETLAYVGTLDFDSPLGGQVDAANAIRSAGSALKPFIYYEALRGGFIVADSVLLDAPVRFSTYSPENYSGKFSGRVSAAQALSASLNTPVIRLLSQVGERRISDRFDALGLGTPGQVVTNGLSLALGTAGYRLADVARAYLSLVPDHRRDVEEGARVMLSEMLRQIPLPETELPVAWKTGTSNNNCDAWCFAYTPDYVLGVWFGNKDGRRSSRLVGAEVAAPAAGEIFGMLYRGRGPFWPERAGYFLRMPLCAATGCLATSACAETTEGEVIGTLPLRLCPACGGGAKRLAIISPAPGTYARDDGAAALKMRLDSGGAGAVWFVDGTMLEEGTVEFAFGPGRHAVVAVPHDETCLSSQVEFVVR